MWHGLLANIPSGFALCDGENGTPDLRGKFVKGAAASVDPGATGGAATHTHAVGTYATDVHAGVTVQDHASHTHDLASNLATPDLLVEDLTATGVSARTGGPSATLTHSVTQPNNHTISGVSAAGSNEPAFYVVAYIMSL